MRGSRKPASRSKIMTRQAIVRQFAEQRAARQRSRERRKAAAARDNYQPRKADRGKLVMVGTKGQRSPQKKGRKGYLVYVTRTGKKQLVSVKGAKGQFRARKFSELQIPQRRNLHKRAEQFKRARLTELARGHVGKSGQGSVSGKGFERSTVKQLAKTIDKAIKSQVGKRVYLVNVIALLSNGQTIEMDFSIGKSEIFFFQQNPEQFIRTAFYAAFAKQLAFHGLITSGSANHIRRVTGEEEITPEVWEDYHAERGRDGMTWDGDMMEVDIQKLEWKVQRS